MKRMVPVALLFAGCICLVIGCVKQDETKSQPMVVLPAPTVVEEKPEPEPAKETETTPPHWLQVNPMRLKMQSMWVSCGEINAMASGAFGIVDFDTLETNAGNIARKANEFGDMWEAIRDANREMAARAKTGDWFEARFESQRIWKSCTDCHVENWSLHTRGFLPQTIEGWVENGNPIDGVHYGKLKLTSPLPYRQAMYRMVSLLDRSVDGVESNDSRVVLDHAQSLHEIVNEQLELWQAIERHANKIVETASKADTTGIDSSYAKMTENCVSCHAKYVQDERLPLNPMAWKYR